MQNGKRAIWLLLVVVLAACSITQNVKPVTPAESKGLSVRVLDPGAGISACPLLTTYSANWRWDLAMYMAYAEMTVYRDGNEVGKATYDALMGGGRVDKKFIKADEKVRELVNQLFPS